MPMRSPTSAIGRFMTLALMIMEFALALTANLTLF